MFRGFEVGFEVSFDVGFMWGIAGGRSLSRRTAGTARPADRALAIVTDDANATAIGTQPAPREEVESLSLSAAMLGISLGQGWVAVHVRAAFKSSHDRIAGRVSQEARRESGCR
jgi:hypothetical protein